RRRPRRVRRGQPQVRPGSRGQAGGRLIAAAAAPTYAADMTEDENHLIAERRAKLAELRAQGIAFPNDFRRLDHAGDLQAEYDGVEEFGDRRVALAGRLLAKRVMGKAAF